MITRKLLYRLAVLTIAAVFTFSCSKDDPATPATNTEVKASISYPTLTGFTLTFDAAVASLAATDIAIDGSATITSVTAVGTDNKVYNVVTSTLVAGTKYNITITKTGFSFSGTLSFNAPTTADSPAHIFKLDATNFVASLQMSQAEYDSWKANDDFNKDEKREAVVKDIYKKFKDDFDFIYLVLNEANYPSTIQYTGQMIPVSNNIQGIGVTPFDYSAKYGSAGKLKGVIQLCKKTNIQNGPTLHELCHYWGNFIVPTSATFNYGSEVNLPDAKPHWGFTGGDVKGQMGGFAQSSLQPNADNTFTVDAFGWNANGGNFTNYTQMELYLMGLIPLSQVADFSVFLSVNSEVYNSTNKTSTFKGTEVKYDQAKLQTVLGTRVPSSATSQKEFKILFVVLTPTELNDTDFAAFSKQSSWFSTTEPDNSQYVNFNEATGGKAKVITGELDKSTL